MSQDSLIISDGTGIQVLNAINAAYQTLNTLSAGAVAPAELVVGMLWADTANNLLKRLASTGPSVWTTLGTLGTNMGMLPVTGGTLSGPLTVSGGDITMTGKVVEMDSAAPASATTMVITGGNLLQPSGTTTITAFGTAQAGAIRFIHFTTALQLTHSANFYLPGAQNITTASGDIATFVCTVDNTTWKLATYQRADGGIVLGGPSFHKQGTDITAAATTNLATATGDFVKVTNTSGTIAITALGTVQAGTIRIVNFSVTGGSLSITHNATSLILPGGQNISITDGDNGIFISLGSGNWRMLILQRNSLVARIWAPVTKTGNYTVLSSDYGIYITSTSSTPNTFTLPSATTAGNGFVLGIRNTNTASALATITPNGADTIENTANLPLGVNSAVTLICDGVSKWVRIDTGIAPSGPPAFVVGSQVFSSGVGTYTVPAGTWYIRVSVWGAGGSGGTGNSGTNARTSGAGGGSGAFGSGIFSVVPGQTYTVTIGAGGVSPAFVTTNSSGTVGGTGGTSSFASLLSCTGGAGGAGAGGAGGAGGTATGSGTLLNGASGGAGYTNASGAGGGGGASAAGLSSGAVSGIAATGAAGAAGVSGSGGAAGGAGGNTNSFGGPGGAGTNVAGTTRESGGGGGGGGHASTGSISLNTGAGGDAGTPGSGGGGGNGTEPGAGFRNSVGGTGGVGKCIVEW